MSAAALDATTRRLVWRGVAEGAFPRPNPSDERVAELVARLFASYPAAVPSVLAD